MIEGDNLPPKVSAILQEQLANCSQFFEEVLETAINEAEEALFQQADRSRNNDEQQQKMAAVAEIKHQRNAIIEKALKPLPARVLNFGEPLDTAITKPRRTTLSLLSKQSQDESVILEDLATRAEGHATLTLFEMGHRYAVMAGMPVIEASDQPFSPTVFCECTRRATTDLQLLPDHKVLIYDAFKTAFMAGMTELYDKLNARLLEQGILPNLRIYAFRRKNTPAPVASSQGAAASDKGSKREREGFSDTANTDSGSRTASVSAVDNINNEIETSASQHQVKEQSAQVGHEHFDQERQGRTPQNSPAAPVSKSATTDNKTTAPTGRPKSSDSHHVADAPREKAGAEYQRYAAIASLLSDHREKDEPTTERQGHPPKQQSLDSVFDKLQSQPAVMHAENGDMQPRSMERLRHDLTTHLQYANPEGEAPAFDSEQKNALDLMTMLFDRLSNNIRSNSGSYLLSELQAPLLRVAMADKTFFTNRQHPARNWLERVALASARWGADNDKHDNESGLITHIHRMNRTINREFKGDPSVFDGMANDLQKQLEQLDRRASVAEKRSVEASRGRERLQLAQIKAEVLVNDRLKNYPRSALKRTMLKFAWIDVLTLSLLRHDKGGGGETRETIGLLDAVISRESTGEPADPRPLCDKLVKVFVQSGMEGAEAELLSHEAVGVDVPNSQDAEATRVELEKRLEQRQKTGKGADDKLVKVKKASGDKQELDRLIIQIKQLGFGTWFEYDDPESGKPLYRKLAWFSPRTGNCLFVNRHGIRTHEITIKHLAEAMLDGKVRQKKPEDQRKGSFIERTLDNILSKLKKMGGNESAKEEPA